jgi:hypothetical protein
MRSNSVPKLVMLDWSGLLYQQSQSARRAVGLCLSFKLAPLCLQCAVNYQAESRPNGCGFGGQVHHFGLFLDASFDRAESRPCVTFNRCVPPRSACQRNVQQYCAGARLYYLTFLGEITRFVSLR